MIVRKLNRKGFFLYTFEGYPETCKLFDHGPFIGVFMVPKKYAHHVVPGAEYESLAKMYHSARYNVFHTVWAIDGARAEENRTAGIVQDGSMNGSKAMKTKKASFVYAMVHHGIAYDDALRLWTLECRLSRWHELECGADNGAIVQDDETGKYFWQWSMTGKLSPIADRYTPNVRRVGEIAARYPELSFEINRDPRGWAIQVSEERKA